MLPSCACEHSDVYFTDQGAVAQLGERDVRNVEVRGSIPLSSITGLILTVGKKNVSNSMFVYPRRYHRIMQLARSILILLIIATTSFSVESFRSFSSCISVQDIEIVGDTVWVASSGGIYKHSRSTGEGTLLSNTSSLPDPFHTTLCFDSEKLSGQEQIRDTLPDILLEGRGRFYSYVSAKWPITNLQSHGKYMIVGSVNGLSIFDTKR